MYPLVEQEHQEQQQEDDNNDEEEQDLLALGLGLSSTTSVGSTRNELKSSINSISATRSLSGGSGLSLSFPRLGLGFESEDGNENITNNNNTSSSSSSWAIPPMMKLINNVGGGGPGGGGGGGGFHHCHAQNKLFFQIPRCQYHSSKRPGIWFSLSSSSLGSGRKKQEGGEDYGELPQIPKAYVRVKDEDVTVFMVKKYLVTKLGLTNETQIDISCMGQKLLQSQTLKYVRDDIWFPRLMDSVKTMGSIENNSANHLMPLQYRRSCFLD